MASYNKVAPHHPLQNLLNLSFSPKKNPAILAKHNTFMISDKIMKKTPKGRPKVLINDYYELKQSTRVQTQQTQYVKTSPTEKKSLINLLNIDSPNKKPSLMSSSKGKIKDLHIYTDLKTICREMVDKTSRESEDPNEKKRKKGKISRKLFMLKELQNEYYILQKKSIENYLKGTNVNKELIEMDFYAFAKLKRARLLEYISDLEIKREQTPIEQIISQKDKALLLKFPKKLSESAKKLSLNKEKHQKNLDFLTELIEKQTKMQEYFDNKTDQINQKMDIYNQYYMNYFTPPANPDRLFTSLKDLAVNRFSLANDLMNKVPQNITPVRPTFSKIRPQRSLSKDLTRPSRKESKDNPKIKDFEGIKGKELAGIGVIEKVKRKLEEQDIEYVRNEGEKLMEWKNEMDDKKELERDEKEFLKAVKNGDVKKASFFLIDNKGFVNIKDQIKQTPLHWAAKRGFLDVVKLLIEKGADLNALDMVSRTPKQLAYVNGNKDVYGVLQSTEEFNRRQDEYRRSITKGRTVFRLDPKQIHE